MAIQIAIVYEIGATGRLPRWRSAGLAVLLIMILGYARFAALA